MNNMNKYLYIFFLLISNSLLSYPYGKWYPNNVSEYILLNTSSEDIVAKSRADRRNTLCDEKNIYINNFFPYISNDHRQLGDILKDHFSDISDKDLQMLKNKNLNMSLSAKDYIDSYLRYLEACKIYIRVINNFKGVCHEEADADEKVIDEIIKETKKPPYNYVILNNLKSKLTNRETMRRIWDKMHTESLFLFDHYYSKDIKNPQIIIPTLRVCFVSHFDMCEKCERMMTNLVEQMDSCKSFCFRKNPDYEYKISVGSLQEYCCSRNRNGFCKLVKIKRFHM